MLGGLLNPLARLAPASDIANLLILVAPLVVLAPVLADRAAWKAWWGRPESSLILAGLVPLLPLAVQVGPSGLGLHRDWDANALLGVMLTMASLLALSRLPVHRLRGALSWSLPALALVAASWVAVNANEAAGVRRAVALATEPSPLAPSQRSQVLLYLAGWSASRGRVHEAGAFYERSYDLAPTPNRGLLGAFAWVRAGELAAARRLLNRVRAQGGLDSSNRVDADSLEAGLTRLEQVRQP